MGEVDVTNSALSEPRLCATRSLSNHSEIDFLDYLKYDERPIFVLDLKGRNSIVTHLAGSLAFCNPALSRVSSLYDSVLGIFSPPKGDTQPEEGAFAGWIIEETQRHGFGNHKIFFGNLWTVTLLPQHWAVVSGIEITQCDVGSFNDHKTQCNNLPGKDAALPVESDSGITSQSWQNQDTSTAKSKGLRCTKNEVWPPLGLGDSKYLSWIREFDWASTSLGPTETWPRLMKQACEMMFANPEPATVFWGRDLILIYNEAYVVLAGNKHPAMMGGSAREHWKEVWDQYDPLFDKMFIDGKPFTQDNTQLFIHRAGYLEEGFFNMRVIPVTDDDGTVVGFYEPVSEVTKQVLLDRRMHMLLELSENTSSETSVCGLWSRLLEALSSHPSDIHFSLLYGLQDQAQSKSGPCLQLKGAIGSGIEPQDLQQTLSMDGPEESGIVGSLRSAYKTSTPVLLAVSDESLSPSMAEELRIAGLSTVPRACIIHPLRSSVDDRTEALLLLGISPNRPFDEDCELFVNLLVRQIESTITSVKLLEKEKDRLKEEAVYNSEQKFKKFAENAPVGIFSFDAMGNITFCNESWLELSGHQRDDMSAMSWTRDVHPDSVGEVQGYWDKLVNLQGPQTFEVQYKKPWRPSHLADESISLDRTWVVASAYAEVSEEGNLTAVLGCVTDISSFKWLDQLQSQRLSEALEHKRQQENFLDITSHEMRNPLNAIIHCAAELLDLITRLTQVVPPPNQSAILRECLDASQTIVYCGKHQKRIIDDVLTLSKLDSNLLSISPAETRPVDLVNEVLKIFDSELRASGIETKTVLTESCKALKMETLLVDSHRLLQILINLVANAVKFTKGEPLRNLYITIDAQTTEPVSAEDGVCYVPSGRRPADPTVHSEWGTGETLFLKFSVQDTGPGMSREETELLFNRFAQGSPRTHVQYGGSGLGLFISRELAELHGGRIGISSKLGSGSAFCFYVKGRRPAERHPLRPSLATRGSTENGTLSGYWPPRLQSIGGSHPDPSGIHVLIVEDNLINQKILAKLIKRQGWAVSVTNHGKEALAEIDKSAWRLDPCPVRSDPTKISMVLADIEMPVMNGKEFVRHVRKLQASGNLVSDIPVVAVTGNARNEQIQQAKEHGFDEVISKPYREKDITAVVLHYINKCNTYSGQYKAELGINDN